MQNDSVNYVDLWGLCKGDKIVFDTNILDVKYQYNLPKNMNGVWSVATPQWPTKSTRITSEFGNSHPLGIDIGATIPGEKREAIKAAMSGTITTAGVPTWSKSESTYVVIKGDDGYEYRYVHLDIGPVLTGQRVEQGRIIGFMSNNGAEGHVHPHFEIRDENIPTNPFDYY